MVRTPAPWATRWRVTTPPRSRPPAARPAGAGPRRGERSEPSAEPQQDARRRRGTRSPRTPSRYDTKLPIAVSPMTSGVNGFEANRRRRIERVAEVVEPPLQVREDRRAAVSGRRRDRQRGATSGAAGAAGTARQQPDAEREHRRLERRGLDRRHADVVVQDVQLAEVARSCGCRRRRGAAPSGTAAPRIVIVHSGNCALEATRAAAASRRCRIESLVPRSRALAFRRQHVGNAIE